MNLRDAEKGEQGSTYESSDQDRHLRCAPGAFNVQLEIGACLLASEKEKGPDR